jgi:hypothetical protein
MYGCQRVIGLFAVAVVFVAAAVDIVAAAGTADVRYSLLFLVQLELVLMLMLMLIMMGGSLHHHQF